MHLSDQTNNKAVVVKQHTEMYREHVVTCERQDHRGACNGETQPEQWHRDLCWQPSQRKAQHCLEET